MINERKMITFKKVEVVDSKCTIPGFITLIDEHDNECYIRGTAIDTFYIETAFTYNAYYSSTSLPKTLEHYRLVINVDNVTYISLPSKYLGEIQCMEASLTSLLKENA